MRVIKTRFMKIFALYRQKAKVQIANLVLWWNKVTQKIHLSCSFSINARDSTYKG